ncbi:MAG: hypothetical protein ACOC97_01540 [Myxococcota bacterium]
MTAIHRSLAPCLACLLLLAVSGCDSDSPPENDAGRDAAPGDAAVDGGGDGGEACPLPTGGLYATFSVVGEVFRAHLTSDTAIEDAIDLWQGRSSASIPNGDLACEPAPHNCGYTWHMVPGTIEFAELTIEVCDGTPSYIEENCDDFVDNYCPWSAELVDLRDCRTDPTCPSVPTE